MLRGVVICPDQELREDLKDALAETQLVGIVRALDRYPSQLDLGRFLRAAAPEVVFLSVESRRQALELAAGVEAQAPGTQIVAVDRTCHPDALLETMRAGIREFLAPPFDPEAVKQLIERVAQTVEKQPPTIESTDSVLAFLPSKAGVGCSTVALNTSIMLSQLPDMKVLLADFDLNCGMIGFMLQLDSPYSIVSAAENAHQMDENLWQKLVSSHGNLDVLHAGKLAPGFRIEATQIRYLLDFARRNYKAICIDLSGILEKFSLEILHEAKQIFLVCTAEVPSLHLAREKLRFLRNLDLDGRVKVLLNRAQRHSFIPVSEVEKLLQLPVYMSFPNDYMGVHKALTAGKNVDASSELGRGFRALAESIHDVKKPVEHARPSLLEIFRSRKKPEPASADHGVLAS
jgi:pilus assembly protein CpaE